MLIEERLTYFQTKIQDIREHKMNEWRFSNYGVLIQAALTAVHINLGNSSSGAAAILSVLSVVACGVILWLIYEAMTQIRHSQRVYEDLMTESAETFHQAFEKYQVWKEERRPSFRKIRATLPEMRAILHEMWPAAKELVVLLPLIQIIAMVMAIAVIWFGDLSVTPCSGT